ncbi:hypothetical protein Bca52824_009126 [Brassica carinata]|uniref:Uncharacterized protein n=1 Tax=Brassica carinata TaxID=52824 RepID=A0A8X7WDF5_BRACI|nr:hypothetical protein Bca52824_009126 [Brassica carinata]
MLLYINPSIHSSVTTHKHKKQLEDPKQESKIAKALHMTIILFLVSANFLPFINSTRLLDEIQPQSQFVPTSQIPTVVALTEAEELHQQLHSQLVQQGQDTSRY